MANSADPGKKPTDLILHCLHRQDISGFSRTRVKPKIRNVCFSLKKLSRVVQIFFFFFFLLFFFFFFIKYIFTFFLPKSIRTFFHKSYLQREKSSNLFLCCVVYT